MSDDLLRRSLPNESDRTFTLDQMIEYLTTPDVVNEVVSSMKSSGCQDTVTIEMVATALQHNGFHKEFVDFLTHFSQEKIKNIYIPRVHLSLYYLQNCLRSPNDSEADENRVEETIRQAWALDYRYFFIWLARCFFELYRGNLKTANDYYDTGLSLFEQSKRQQGSDKKSNEDQAINDITKIFNLVPFLSLANGLLQFAMGEYQGAFQEFKKLFNTSIPAFPLIRLAIGMCLEKLDKRDDAILAYKRCLEIDPTNLTVLIRLILLDKASLVQYYEAAKKVNSKSIALRILELQLRFENIKLQEKKKDKKFVKLAGALYEDIPKRQVEFKAEALFQLARYWHYTGKKTPEELIDYYQEVLNVYKDHLQAQFAISHLSVAIGKYKVAIDYLKPVIASYTTQFEPHFVLGMALAQAYKNDNKTDTANQAKAQLSEAIRLSQGKTFKDLYKVHSTLGWLCLKTLEYDSAYSNLKSSVALLEQNNMKPDDQTLTFLGISQFELEKYPEALKTFESVSNKSNAIVRFNIGRCMETLGRLKDAKEYYTKLTEDFPRFPEPYLRLGVISVAEKDYLTAEQYFKTVDEECPEQKIRAMLYLADLYLHSKPRVSMQYADEVRKLTTNIVPNSSSSNFSDGYLTANVYLANAYLIDSQKPNLQQSERLHNLDKATSFYHAALRGNKYCISAASGLALCWLLRGAAKDTIQYLRLVKENMERLPGPAECLANAYLTGGGIGSMDNNGRDPDQAAKEFEACNKEHYERTNTGLFAGAFQAYKASQKYDRCLEMAEYMIQLEPDRIMFRDFLANSLFKSVETNSSSHVTERSKLRVSMVDMWVSQLNRALELYELSKQEAQNDYKRIDYYNKYIERIKKIIKKCDILRKKAEENERERALKYAKSIPDLPDPDMSQRL
ncbi:TPR Domain containing protein [Trichomonas vaginalis G3]|uniref:TPR Domain containing protein n=1 Tax=Trichomonas vaginalis (strain ATCC PRA-98 / G3) TaxID=412133 RepID=A2E0D1_TRIV3|nr:regulation of histone H3-K4 methylation [Trichomonas vaginalis G3]EAY13931.1 TPR Domain containing protein [Trichomonas vaginalis G3]KAI5520874.1 regulation of histone H3-K4 methylation [Trichomonas vaginalis G3]|eukprot:XP_001326154.1 TPR Domain containing protein [Trichomonas vaginalis G3]